MSVKYEGNKKIILAEDSRDGLTDSLADMLLLLGGDEEALGDAIHEALGTARDHYNAEKDGNSEGYDVFVDQQDGERKLIPITTWAKQLGKDDEDEGERYTVGGTGPFYIMDGGARHEDNKTEYNTIAHAQEEADRLNATD